MIFVQLNSRRHRLLDTYNNSKVQEEKYMFEISVCIVVALHDDKKTKAGTFLFFLTTMLMRCLCSAIPDVSAFPTISMRILYDIL